MVLFHHVVMETRTLVDTENAGHTSDDSADRASNNRTDRPRSPFAFASAMLHPAGYALGDGGYGETQRNCDCGSSKNVTDHQIFLRS
jgi:hypothetical protein